MRNSSSKIKSFIRFNESSQDIDWDKFKDFLEDDNYPGMIKKYQIDKGEIGDLLSDIEDVMDIEYSASQNFQISLDKKIRHNMRIILMMKPPSKFIAVRNPSDQLFNLNLFHSIISEVEVFVRKINSFFKMELRSYKYPDMMSPLNFILDFSMEIDDLEIVEKIYLEYLNKSQKIDVDKKWDPIIPKEMAKKVLSNIVDHLRYNDVDIFAVENDPNEVRIEYHPGGKDVGCPGGFHIFIGGDMVTRQSLDRDDDNKNPYSYVDWDFINTKFGLM